MTYHYPPKLMQTRAAARYLGFSVTKFRSLGIQSKRDGGNVVYDRDDFDAYADSLPYEKASEPPKSAFDQWKADQHESRA